MADTHSKRATYQDIVDLPPNMVGEIIRGALYAQPRPRRKHIRASSKLGFLVGAPFDYDPAGPGGWIILDEIEIQFGDDFLVPDVSGWRAERYPESSNDTVLTIAPDWVCEVLSPSTARVDRVVKSEIYAEHGVEFMWLIDPEEKILEAFRLTGGKWLRIAALTGDADVRVEPFDAISFQLESLWT